MTVSDSGLILYKGSRFLVPRLLRAGLLKALHIGHPGVLSMVMRAKETFWRPGLKEDIAQVRAVMSPECSIPAKGTIYGGANYTICI